MKNERGEIEKITDEQNQKASKTRKDNLFISTIAARVYLAAILYVVYHPIVTHNKFTPKSSKLKFSQTFDKQHNKWYNK